MHTLQKILILLALTSSAYGQGYGRSVTCSNCAIQASSVNTFRTNTPLTEPSFPAGCNGEIKLTNAGTVQGEYQTYEASLIQSDPLACPLQIQVDEQRINLLHAANGALSYTGYATGGATLIADNGLISVVGGGDDSLTIQAGNGGVTLDHMGGNINISAKNGAVNLTSCYGFNLNVAVENGSINATKLSLYPKKTASLITVNGSINLKGVSSDVLDKTGTVKGPAKVRIHAHVVNGSIRDRRSKKQKTLSAAERKKAAILQLNAENGDVLIR